MSTFSKSIKIFLYSIFMTFVLLVLCSLNTYAYDSTFNVTIPKNIVLDGNTGTGNYEVFVNGNIVEGESAIINVIPDTNFQLKNLVNISKSSRNAYVSQDKISWEYDDIVKGIKTKGVIQANNITAGKWQGNFNFKVSIEVKSMSISTTNGVATYNGKSTNGGAKVEVITPNSGTVIKYGTTKGNYNLTSMPTFINAGTYEVFYQVSATNYAAKTGSIIMNINKANNELSLSSSTGTTCIGKNLSFTINNPSGGNLEVKALDNSIANVSLANNVVTIKPLKVGKTTITVTSGENQNYKGASKTFEVNFTNHNSISSNNAVSPTCTTNGKETDTKCSICNSKLTTGAIIPATGHSYGTPIYTWSSNGKSCVAKRVCTNDSSHIETENATITNKIKVNANCTTKGTTTYTATFKNSAYTTQTKNVQDINALGHNYSSSYTIDVMATCTESGSKSQHCSRCDAKQNVTSIPATGHNYGTPTYTWSDDGKSCTAQRVCANDSSHIETENATITSTMKTAATCTVNGTTTYTATFKNSAYTSQTKDVQDINALGHGETKTVTQYVPLSRLGIEKDVTDTCKYCNQEYGVINETAWGYAYKEDKTICSRCNATLSSKKTYIKLGFSDRQYVSTSNNYQPWGFKYNNSMCSGNLHIIFELPFFIIDLDYNQAYSNGNCMDCPGHDYVYISNYGYGIWACKYCGIWHN